MTSSESGKATSWQLPSLHPTPREPAPDLAAMSERARAEGYTAGHAEGLAAGRAAAEAATRELSVLCQALAAPFREQESVLLADLTTLVSRVASAVVRRELETSAALIEGVLAEALEVMGDVESTIRIRVHPLDYRRARDFLAGIEFGQPVELLEDTAVSRGGCLLSTPVSFLDASLERRLEDSLQALREAAEGSSGLGDPEHNGEAGG